MAGNGRFRSQDVSAGALAVKFKPISLSDPVNTLTKFQGMIASGSKDNQQPVKLWDARTGATLCTLHAHKNTVMDLAWNQVPQRRKLRFLDTQPLTILYGTSHGVQTF